MFQSTGNAKVNDNNRLGQVPQIRYHNISNFCVSPEHHQYKSLANKRAAQADKQYRRNTPMIRKLPHICNADSTKQVAQFICLRPSKVFLVLWHQPGFELTQSVINLASGCWLHSHKSNLHTAAAKNLFPATTTHRMLTATQTNKLLKNKNSLHSDAKKAFSSEMKHTKENSSSHQLHQFLKHCYLHYKASTSNLSEDHRFACMYIYI